MKAETTTTMNNDGSGVGVGEQSFRKDAVNAAGNANGDHHTAVAQIKRSLATKPEYKGGDGQIGAAAAAAAKGRRRRQEPPKGQKN